jgi:integrase/recombinase XerD
MRITEALSLKVAEVKLDTGEAQIVGKGNKQRTVFFTPRALGWVREFVNRRTDRSEWLFVCPNGAPFTVNTVQKNFRFIRTRSGLSKRVSPHILRHTCATTLLFNGCPIGFIKEVLGHDRLETTCRYYLGVDKKAAKEAHQKYLSIRRQNSNSAHCRLTVPAKVCDCDRASPSPGANQEKRSSICEES